MSYRSANKNNAMTNTMTLEQPKPAAVSSMRLCGDIPCVDVPEGKNGNWRVERFSVSDDDVKLHNMRCMFQAGMGRRTMRAGTYTRLMRGGCVVMSDTDAEKSDHRCAVHSAKGVILLNGLGIGMVLNACLMKPEVERAIVVELSPEVIALCGEHYRKKFGERVEIVNANAMTYMPPRGLRFGMVWHDIWDNICADNLPEMATMHRRYGRKTDWQGSWCKELCSL